VKNDIVCILSKGGYRSFFFWTITEHVSTKIKPKVLLTDLLGSTVRKYLKKQEQPQRTRNNKT